MLSQPAVFLFFLNLLYNSAFAASAPATALVDGPEEFRAALLDGRVQRIVLEGAVLLPPHRDSTPRFLINRNVTIMSLPGSMHELDFNHAAGCALVCSRCTVTFSSIVVANAKRLQAVTCFRGVGPGSKIVFKDSYITQLACAPPAAGRSILRDAPRSRQFPQHQQPQQLLESTDATYKGRLYRGSIRALDVAVDLPLEVLEREIFTGGYSLLYENVTQLCLSAVPDSCLARSSLALCIEEQTQQLESGRAAAARESGAAAVAVISGSPQQGSETASFTAGAVAGAVVGAVAGTTLLLAACAATWHVRRKRAQRSKGGLSPPDSWMFILPSYQLQDERRRKLGWLSGLQAGSSSAGDSGDSGPPAPEPQDRGQRLSAAITTKVLNIIEQRPFGGVSVVGDGAAGGTALRRGLSGGVVSDATGTDDSESELAPRSSGAGSRPVSLEALEAEEDQPQILRAIGRGGFGTVYKAIWHGATVAVKVVQLPPGSKAVSAAAQKKEVTWDMGLHKDMRPGGASAIEDMAVQEAAIGSSMAHPNIVAVYSVLLKPMQQYQPSQLRMLRRASADEQAEEPTDNGDESSDAAADTAASPKDTDTDLVPWEMQLIMEYCDQGTLRDVLDAQLIFDRSTGTNHIPTVLSLAQQVARAMQYLHKEHILHGDLKASNVLLQSAVQFSSFTGQRSPAVVGAATDAPLEGLPEQQQAALPGCDLQWLPLRSGCSVTAKVSDFGLSTSLDPASTHITRRGPGTVTHTAPETLVHGHCSRASDVYAYGMLLYELATGNRVFADVPQMMIGRLVVEQKVRPKWPAALTSNACWSGIISLVEICWQQNPHARPTFSEVLAELRSLARGNRVSLSITDRLHRAVSAAAAEAPAAQAPPPPPAAAEWRLDNSSGSHHQHAPAALRSVAGVSSAAAHPLLYQQQQQQQQRQGQSNDGCMVLQPLDNTAGSMASTSTVDAHQQPLLCVPESLLYQPSSVARRAAAAADAAAAGTIVLQPLDGTAEEPPGGGL